MAGAPWWNSWAWMRCRQARQAPDLIARALQADAADVFLYDAATAGLLAAGAPRSPMGLRQRATGLDRRPLCAGGLVVKVFRAGGGYLTGDAGREPDERRDVVRILGVRSAVLCRLEVDGEPRGVLQAASTRADRFDGADLWFLQAACRWVGLLTRQAELIERTRDAPPGGGGRAGGGRAPGRPGR